VVIEDVDRSCSRCRRRSKASASPARAIIASSIANIQYHLTSNPAHSGFTMNSAITHVPHQIRRVTRRRSTSAAVTRPSSQHGAHSPRFIGVHGTWVHTRPGATVGPIQVDTLTGAGVSSSPVVGDGHRVVTVQGDNAAPRAGALGFIGGGAQTYRNDFTQAWPMALGRYRQATKS